MAQPKWLKKYLTMRSEVSTIFEDLEQYRDFCVNYGHVFDEKDLYNERNISYQDFLRYKSGKHVKNRWYQRDDDNRPRMPRGHTNYRARNNNA
jgi:hypothetical protein